MLTEGVGSLVGKLAHAARVVRPGKTFMARMFKLLSGVRQAHHRVCLNLSFRSDLQWWGSFLTGWNGVSLMKSAAGSQSSVHIRTDTSGSFGCGAVVPSSQEWIQLQSYPEEWMQLKHESITLKELLPVLLACAVWGREWMNQTVTIHVITCEQWPWLTQATAGCHKSCTF